MYLWWGTEGKSFPECVLTKGGWERGNEEGGVSMGLLLLPARLKTKFARWTHWEERGRKGELTV